MEYIYAALLLHSAGKELSETNVKAVLESAGIKPEEARIKALVASLEGVNIKELLATTAFLPQMPSVVPSAPSAGAAPEEEKKAEKEKKVSEEEAAEGLGALFG